MVLDYVEEKKLILELETPIAGIQQSFKKTHSKSKNKNKNYSYV